MNIRGVWVAAVLIAAPLNVTALGQAREQQPMIEVLQYGTMHEAIGQQRHQGRVRFSQLLKKPHFYGVAALERLQGEATILDGALTVTVVDDQGRIKSASAAPEELQATLIVGAYVDSWSEHRVPEDVAADSFDSFVSETAANAGLDTNKPFVFTLQGNMRDVRLHVIHGACPIHARLKKLALAREEKPFEAEFSNVEGTIVGVHAKDAVGKLTHPATSTHVHLMFIDPGTKAKVTGHVEKIAIAKGAILRLPKTKP